MSDNFQKKYNLAWHQHSDYWLTFYAKNHQFESALLADLKQAGLKTLPGDSSPSPEVLGTHTPQKWKEQWSAVYSVLSKHHALDAVEVALTPGKDVPSETLIKRQKVESIESIAQSMWLGDALIEDRIVCYLQPVHSNGDKVFGYESFARVVGEDGKVIAGDKIVSASKALGIEYMIDRHLQVQAIKTFVSSQFNGFLFINFFPGFIHRPSVYMEGLAETVKSFGVVPKHIVLDFTNSETPHDMMHLKNVCEYGRSCGYSIALDDIESVQCMQRLFPEIRPDFVKIDMNLVHQLENAQSRETVKQIVDMAHASNATVIGEGVETDDMFQVLRQLDVDLFQGYLFSPPLPVEQALKQSTG